jgi:hypothetical protein
VGITIGREAALGVFHRALEIARSRTRVPPEWEERTRRISEAPSKTFVPALGTALLAKATDPRIDALSLRESSGHKGYSARNLAKEVLVPETVRAGINIRSEGAEPLNNQPFLRAEKIGTHLKVRTNALAHLEYLVESVTKVDFLDAEGATMALAAFLRARAAATPSYAKIRPPSGTKDLPEVLGILDRFVSTWPESGKVAQALGAAILDTIHPHVQTKRINDPSARWPGDVGIFTDGRLVCSAEVKQRPFSESELLQFCSRLHAKGLRRGLALAFGQGSRPLNVQETVRAALERHGVALHVFTSPSALFWDATGWSSLDLEETLKRIPERGLARLKELEASPACCQAWVDAFEPSVDAS